MYSMLEWFHDSHGGNTIYVRYVLLRKLPRPSLWYSLIIACLLSFCFPFSSFVSLVFRYCATSSKVWWRHGCMCWPEIFLFPWLSCDGLMTSVSFFRFWLVFLCAFPDRHSSCYCLALSSVPFTVFLVSRLDIASVVILPLLLCFPYRISKHGRQPSDRFPISALY